MVAGAFPFVGPPPRGDFLKEVELKLNQPEKPTENAFIEAING